MKKRKGLTRIEAIIVIFVIVFIGSSYYFFRVTTKQIAQRVVCGSNLSGIGNAIFVYANDYDDNYPQLPGEGPWSEQLGFDYDLEKPDFNGAQSNSPRTITASWYLLVREADISPKSFVCSGAPFQPGIDGFTPPKNRDLVDLWDFGSEPHKYVSYAMHNPYGKYPANGNLSAAFAIAADMSPWFAEGNIVKPSPKQKYPQVINLANPGTWKRGNSLFHKNRNPFVKSCQNIVYADGHRSVEKQPNVGVNNDNIYTFWSTDESPTDQDIQGGTAPTSRSPENDAKSETDSFLAI